LASRINIDLIPEIGCGLNQLENLQKAVNAENSDLFDVLAYVAYSKPLVSRLERVENRKGLILDGLNSEQKDFLKFVLKRYVNEGFEELFEDRLAGLLELKYHSIFDAAQSFGGPEKIRSTFFDFQELLYSKGVGGEMEKTVSI
jgi:type I restriction enzyme, R subunit